MAIRRTSTRRIIAKPAAKRKEAWEKKRRKTSRVAPKRKTAPTKRRSSRVTKKAAVKKRRTSRKTPAKRRTSQTKATKGRSSTTDEQDSVADTHELLAKWNVPGYRVEFMNRMNPIGQCNWSRKVISYSREWWMVMSPFERKRTVIHEVAHAVVRADALDRGIYLAPHGKEWKAQMRSMGIREPRARSTIANSADVARFSHAHVGIRCCGRDRRMTIRKFHNWKKRGALCSCGRGKPPSTPVLLTKEDEQKYANYLKTRRLVRNGVRVVNVCGNC